ncbi:MAG: ABC transporter ATP-binding protein [Coriobacteriaceae bacterium]|nr:ABC transporter ATP-binding protein [Coriobacteriaceae bacterium]
MPDSPIKDSSEAILEVEGLFLSFTQYGAGLRQRTLEVIHDLTLSANSGEVVAVVGASGSGKSLLAHAIFGILPDNAQVEGSIKFKGKELDDERRKELRGSKMAFVPQSVDYLDPLMRTSEQVRGVRGTIEKARMALDRFGLDESVDRLYPFELSGGMARRVLVSTAVIEDADLIVADEPTPGMTLDMAKEAMKTFREFADAGKAVVVITHDLDLAYETADKIVVFYAGQTAEIADAADFRDGASRLRHPYSKALMDALPQRGFEPIPGTQPYADNLPAGCLFAERCKYRTAECQNGHPALIEFNGGHVRCLRPRAWLDEGGAEVSGTPKKAVPAASQQQPLCHPTPNGKLLEARRVSFAYKKGKPVLESVDFAMTEGEIVGLYGPSGRGKSTLAYLLSGREEPSGGEILWDGSPLPKRGYRPIQLIYQHPERAINPRWQLGKTLEESWVPPEELQEALGIEEAWKKRWPNELSGGELQRFCIARALNPKTRILICDEITTMLDVITQAQVWNAIVAHARDNGMGVLAITHNRALANRICDRVVEI